LFIGFLVEPFISPGMSLSDQLTSLSAANHFLYILYARNRTSFCPGQWFYDVGSLIKNIFFTAGRHKVTDGAPEEYYILQDGTDRLEGNFGIYRDMDSSHNVDILQLSHRASSAAEVAQIYAHHPEWDHGHKRLRLQGVDGVDHTNPASWKGDVSVHNVSLLTCWKSG
ncbi:hypothetical protein OH76DRAFT_1300955, partial [Lentinus brumalis]